MEIITLIIAGIILLLPLVFWMYIFIAFEHLGITRKEFLIGILAGALTTIPLVYSDTIFFGNLIEEVFFQLIYIGDDILGLGLFSKIFTFFASIFVLIILIVKFILQQSARKYIYSSCWYSLIILLSCFLIYTMYYGLFGIGQNTPIYSGSLVFSGLGAIAGYYVVISLLEEGMKYLGNTHLLISENKDIQFSKVLAFSAVVALGFSFFENILYSYISYRENGVDGLLSLIFFRSLFTVSLHILCSMFLAAGFYMILMMRKYDTKSYLLFFFFTSISILAHTLFDTSLSFDYTAVVFLYLFSLYIFIIFITSPDGSHQNIG